MVPGDDDREGRGPDRDDDRPRDGFGDDLEADDEPPLGAPPDRMDRLWVHPAELALPASTAHAPTTHRQSRFGALALPLACGALGAIAAIVVLGLVGAFDADPNGTPASRALERAEENEDTLAALTDAVAPGLVVVTVKDANGARQSSGVCVRARGEILTSAHTLGGATNAEITTSDGETMPAVVVGRDDITGVVLLDADRPLRTAALAESPSRAGNNVWIFGAHPPGQSSPWVSDGIVASVDGMLASPPGPATTGLIETDALANDWAAGGALVDRTGAVTGIVLWPAPDQRGSHAVPIGRALALANELREKGYAVHGMIDATMQDTPAGPVVADVPAGSAAARTGLLTGDRLLEVDGREVLDVAEVRAAAHGTAPGSTVRVRVQRGAAPLRLDVELATTAPAG